MQLLIGKKEIVSDRSGTRLKRLGGRDHSEFEKKLERNPPQLGTENHGKGQGGKGRSRATQGPGTHLGGFAPFSEQREATEQQVRYGLQRDLESSKQTTLAVSEK